MQGQHTLKTANVYLIYSFIKAIDHIKVRDIYK